MRIIAGKYRSRVLKQFNFDNIRPTSDRAKEAIFSMLNNDIINCSFLDLFSGTGAVGLEALSRGAKTVTMVDSNKNSIELIKQNAKMLNADCKVIFSDSLNFLVATKDKFDVIFIDPPYDSDLGEMALNLIVDSDIIHKDSIVIHEFEKPIKEPIAGLTLVKTKKYGIANFNIYKRTGEV